MRLPTNPPGRALLVLAGTALAGCAWLDAQPRVRPCPRCAPPTVCTSGSAAPAPAEAEDRIVQAVEDLPEGTMLRTSLLQVVPRPPGLTWSGHLRPVDLVHFAGLRTVRAVRRGEAIRRSDLVAEVAGGGPPPTTGPPTTAPAVRVPPGARAVALRVDWVAGAGFWVKRGDRVDIALVANRGQPPQPTVTMLMPAATVIAASADPGPGAGGARTCTVLALPQEAQALALAQTLGRIVLLPRSAADGRSAVYPPVTRSDIESPAFWEKLAQERRRSLPPVEVPDDPGIRAK
jgi:Flp pilus assembly protein CpaB